MTANGTRVITLTTVAVDARTGVRQWATRWDQPGGTDGQAFAVTTSPDGSRTYAVGQSSPARGGDQMTAVAYDTGTGAIAWATAVPGATQAKSVAASPDGRTVYLAGFGFTGDATGDDIVVAALDAKTGAVRWTSSWDGNGGIGTTGDFADKAVLDPTGRYFIVGGRSDQSDGVDAATVAFDTTAHAVAWSALEHGGANDFDEVNDIAVDPQGRAVYVTGSTEDDTTGGHTAFTIAYTLPGGQQEWLQRFSSGNNEDQGDAIGVSPDGSTVWVAVASASNQPVTPLDIELLGYAAVGGNQTVSGRTTNVQNETPTGLAVSPDGGAIDVVGSIGQGTEDPQNDAYVVTFDPTGAVVSTAEWDAAQRDDRGESITISPDASQLVVGAASIGATSGTDYAVVSYATGRHYTPPPPPKKHPPH